jgi:outer membrane protein OmpA-like peptidoglycan-associated protein
MKLNLTILMSVFGASSLIACASSTPPEELIQARAAYQKASEGPAQVHAPGQLETARQALNRAEEEFDDDGDDVDTRDAAYVATRLSQLADAQANAKLAQDARSRSQQQLAMAQAERDRMTQEALGQARRESSEALARANEAERKTSEAMTLLEKIGEVKEDERGLVLNITGSVLFASGKSTLLPTAKERLAAFADAVSKMPIGQKIVIEGHADSQGSDSFNQRLSEARAKAVKAFLVRNGVASSRLEAEGMGESDPVADNSTPEGRATNRRVEIVIEKAG